jgi:hypothetical protein
MNAFSRRCSVPLPLLLLTTLLAVGAPTDASAQAVDLTGAWLLTVESPNGTGTREVTFVQDGESLSGQISSSQATGLLVGTVDGDDVTFVATVEMTSGSFDITYRATVTGDEMEGSVDFGSYGGGTFTGRRVET